MLLNSKELGSSVYQSLRLLESFRSDFLNGKKIGNYKISSPKQNCSVFEIGFYLTRNDNPNFWIGFSADAWKTWGMSPLWLVAWPTGKVYKERVGKTEQLVKKYEEYNARKNGNTSFILPLIDL
jgi:hypothetical protein